MFRKDDMKNGYDDFYNLTIEQKQIYEDNDVYPFEVETHDDLVDLGDPETIKIQSLINNEPNKQE